MQHPIAVDWLWLIPALPLLGALLNGALGRPMQRRFGEGPIRTIAVLMPALSFAVAAYYVVQLALLPPESRALLNDVYGWVLVGNLRAHMAFWLDPLSAVMTLVVGGVGTLIHVYATGYMHKDPGYWRFFAYLNLFMFAMFMLVLGDNFLLLFIGWEGVGLCSYLLISFWFADPAKAAAGMKAFVVNRVGDFGFLIGLFILFWGLAGAWTPTGYAIVHPDQFSVTFRDIQANIGLLANKEIAGIALPTLIGILFFWGATAKSAQIPLYVWLPDAMAGPTPVSALIHAATMVTAGVYMVARLNFLYELSPVAQTVVATVGALTALFAATIGLFQVDIKKVLAYSTVSQLGFMFMAVGTGAYWVGIFHLMTHAFFKACLFLGSGSVIHGMSGEQDMRRYGGLKKLMPVTAWTYLASTLAIAGFPVFSGFFSKDEILAKVFFNAKTLIPGPVLWAIGATAALCTAFYMFRSYYMTFSGENRADEHTRHHIHESPLSMTLVLRVLAFLAIVGGALGLPALWHLPNLLEGWLEPVFAAGAAAAGTALPHGGAAAAHGGDHILIEWGLMGASVLLALTGFAIARALYRDARSAVPSRLLARFAGAHRVVFNKYYVDEAYDRTAVRGVLSLAWLSDWFDRFVIDRLVEAVAALQRLIGRVHGFVDRVVVDGAVNLVADASIASGRGLRRLQTGRIQSYLYGLLVGALVLVVVRFFWFE